MGQLKLGSPGVTSKEIDLTGPLTQQPVGTPAGVIGTATKGPAFVPLTLGVLSDFYAKFGQTDGKKFGPLAVTEWLRNAGAVTYLRVMGVGDGKRRVQDGTFAGTVNTAGFVVGEKQPDETTGLLASNPYANGGSDSVLGRTYFLGCLMSESIGSTFFSAADLQGAGSTLGNKSSAIPVVRGILMAPSGVIMRLSSTYDSVDSSKPLSTLIATDAASKGGLVGTLVLSDNGVSKQDFVLLLNGHKGTDPLYPNMITASFDVQSPSYFGKPGVLNQDPYAIQKAGHYLYAHWDITNALAVPTGSGIVSVLSGAGASTAVKVGAEASAFITTSSIARNTATTYVPNYENFNDRFRHAVSPWVVSQKFGGQVKNLFRFHAIDDGINISSMYKISFENIRVGDSVTKYGTFDVVIRGWNDRDTDKSVIERFSGCSIDPTSPNYIAKKVGDLNTYFDFDRVETAQKLVVDGSYSNKSNYVRVEVSSDVDLQEIDATALPCGFRGVAHLVTSGSMPMSSPATSEHDVANVLKMAVQPPVPFRLNLTRESGQKISVNPQLYWGVQFEHTLTTTTPNASNLQNESLKSFAKYYPDFMTGYINFVVSDNAGAADSAQNGIVDADRFCNNLFSLENVMIVTGTTGLADPQQWVSASYVRDGNIVANDTLKTRALKTDDFTQTNSQFVKFSMFMQGGFNGVNLFNRDEAELSDAAVYYDMQDAARGYANGPNVKTYQKAIDIMKNVTNVDIQLLAVPGIRQSSITDYALEAVQDRFDAMLIMDVEQKDVNDTLITVSNNGNQASVQNTTQMFTDRALDTNFGAAYFPDVVVQDPNTLTNVIVPPSVVVLGALALNDAVGHPWFAPAGFTRGALPTTLEAAVKLSKANMDQLYDANINPLVAFVTSGPGQQPQGGVVVWGQKTLQQAASALDRVNVRRLLIEIRRQVRQASDSIIFEPNRATTLAKFTANVTPRLQRIQQLAGLQRFKVIIDSSTTTQQDVENNTIRGKIFVQPYKAVEFVSLDFVVTNAGNMTPNA